MSLPSRTPENRHIFEFLDAATTKVLHPVKNIRRTRKNVVGDSRLTKNIIIEKVKKANGGDRFVNGKYYPKYFKYGYRFVNLGMDQRAHTLTLDEMREFMANLMSFMQKQKE